MSTQVLVAGEWRDAPYLSDLRPTVEPGALQAFMHDEPVVTVRGRPWLGYGTPVWRTENPAGWVVTHPRHGTVWVHDATLAIVAREATR